jgi:hypothetical protein
MPRMAIPFGLRAAAALWLVGSPEAQTPATPSQLEVPDASSLAVARGRALATLGDELLSASGGDLAAAQRRLFALADAAADDASRYVLLDLARNLAERQHSPALAIAACGRLAARFKIAATDDALPLLQRMAADGTTPAAAVALAARQQAVAAAQQAEDGSMRALQALATRAAAASNDAWLQAMVAGDGGRLDELHRAFDRWHTAAAASPAREERLQLFAPLFLFPDRLGAATLGEIAGELSDRVEADQAAQALRDLGPQRLLAMSQHARTTWVRRSLQRAAHARFGALFVPTSSDAERDVIARQMTGITSLLADQDGITRLRFRTASDKGQVVAAADHWRVEDGLLVGTAAAQGMDYATHRYAFENVHSVVITGGIRSTPAHNFRLAVGTVNLICNWEGGPENHAYFAGVRQTSGPPALTAGTLHTIALHRTDGGVLVFIDDRLWFTDRQRFAGTSTLDGTVCVYPALGSEIFVREILVDGDLAVAGPVAGPRGDLR